MSEESAEPKPPKLKLSSSKPRTDKPQSTPTTSASTSATPSPPPIAPKPVSTPRTIPTTPPPQANTPPQSVPKPVSTPSATPPPLAKQPAPRTENSARKIEEPVKYVPSPREQNSPIGGILIVIALLLILATAGAGIWFLLKSETAEPVDDTTAEATVAAPSNPIERAKATIDKVPHRNLDDVLETPSGSTVESEVAPVADVLETPSGSTAESEVAPVASVAPTATVKDRVSQYLQNVQISGVRSGARARIQLDGENYNINDTVHEATGLVVIGTRDQRLMFRDRNGIVYVKSF